MYAGLRDMPLWNVVQTQPIQVWQQQQEEAGRTSSLSSLNRQGQETGRDCVNDPRNQSFFFSDWTPQIRQHHLLFPKTAIWSEICLIPSASRPSLFLTGEFCVCASELPKTKQEVSVQAQPTVSCTDTCVTVPPAHRTGWRGESARRTPKHSWAWVCLRRNPTNLLCWHSNPIWAVTPGNQRAARHRWSYNASPVVIKKEVG